MDFDDRPNQVMNSNVSTCPKLPIESQGLVYIIDISLVVIYCVLLISYMHLAFCIGFVIF